MNGLVILKVWVRNVPDPTLNQDIKREIEMKYTILSAMLFIFTGLASSVSQANPQSHSPLSSPFLLAQSNHQSLNSAVQTIKQRTGGRILSAKTVVKNGQRVYKIKVLLPSGKVQTFRINAK